jgi:hypothetical protein
MEPGPARQARQARQVNRAPSLQTLEHWGGEAERKPRWGCEWGGGDGVAAGPVGADRAGEGRGIAFNKHIHRLWQVRMHRLVPPGRIYYLFTDGGLCTEKHRSQCNDAEAASEGRGHCATANWIPNGAARTRPRTHPAPTPGRIPGPGPAGKKLIAEIL